MQNLTDKTFDVSKMIDEQFNPKNSNENLQSLVEQEMRSKGLDPLNKDDVKEFWRSKGIES